VHLWVLEISPEIRPEDNLRYSNRPSMCYSVSDHTLPQLGDATMAQATKTRSQGKSEFLKEYLHDNPRANAKAINAAWKSAGMEGSISDSLVRV
jgi:hypothetical protein